MIEICLHDGAGPNAGWPVNRPYRVGVGLVPRHRVGLQAHCRRGLRRCSYYHRMVTDSDEQIVDPSGLLEGASSEAPLTLELGCRGNKRNRQAVGVDCLAGDGVDVKGNALNVLRRLPGASVSSIYSEHFVEHLDDLEGLLVEVGRVLVDDGEFRAVAPHFSNAHFYSDPTHRRFFGLYTFCYFAEEDIFRRKSPRYGFDAGLRLEGVSLGFKAARPFYFRHGVRIVFGRLVNAHRACQEFYEDTLTGFISCYEVDYRLRRFPR